MLLLNTDNIRFYEEVRKIIQELSPNIPPFQLAEVHVHQQTVFTSRNHNNQHTTFETKQIYPTAVDCI